MNLQSLSLVSWSHWLLITAWAYQAALDRDRQTESASSSYFNGQYDYSSGYIGMEACIKSILFFF